MIYLCHGLPKSASSFAFEIAAGLAEAGGWPQAELYARYLPHFLTPYPPQPYFLRLTDGDLQELAQQVPESELLVVKLHGPLYPDIARLLEAGTCRGLSSYRDPRDAAVSLYDAAHRERRIASGPKRTAFTEIETIEQCIDLIGGALDNTRAWLESPNILPVSYEDLRADPYAEARRIREHIGIDADPVRVLVRYLVDKRRIREFNIGASGRYRTVMSERQEAAAKRVFGDFLNRRSER